MDAEAFIEEIRSNTSQDFGNSYRLFGDSYSLHNQFYKWMTRNPSFARLLGAALQDNTSIVTMQVSLAMLACTNSKDSNDGFYNPLLEFVRNSTCLQEFSFELMERYVDDEDVELLPTIAEAVAANSSITKLELMFFLDSNAYRDNIHEMVAQLTHRQHPETLQELHWSFGMAESNEHEPSIPLALGTLFQTRSTNLKKLRLWNVRIDAEICTTVLESWQTSFATRAETVILDECAFTREGSERFGELLQTSKQNEISRGSTVNGAVVHVRLETGVSGRSLCTLPFSFHCMFLVSTTGRIRVDELQSDILSRVHLPVLAHYLPHALYLQKLCLNVDTDGITEDWNADDEERVRESCGLSAEAFQFPMSALCQQVLVGIRRNGSLTRFELSPEDGVETEFFSTAMERKLDAYLDRNRFLPQLLSDPATDIELVPCLFAAATMARAMAPTNLLIGLSTAKLLLGPLETNRDSKRCCA
jgi:hypothetical protein